MSEVIQSHYGNGFVVSGKQGASRSATKAGISAPGIKYLQNALKVLEESSAPEYEAAVGEATELLAEEIRKRAPGKMAETVVVEKPRRSGAKMRGVISVEHPGAKSMEFGRTFYWVGYRGRAEKTGIKVLHAPGQAAEPFVGIKAGDQAMGAAGPEITRILGQGISDAFARIAEGS